MQIVVSINTLLGLHFLLKLLKFFFHLYLTFFCLSPHQQGTIFSLSLGAESCDPEQPAFPTSVRNKRHRMEREAQRKE